MHLSGFPRPALIEIKPELEFEDLENQKIYDVHSHPVLSMMRSFRDTVYSPVACIFGQPGDHRVWFFGWTLSDGGGGEFEDQNAFWCVSNGTVTLNVHIDNPDRQICSGNLGDALTRHFTYPRDYGFVVEPIELAICCARHARFEHGEKPFVR
jgi:hypothetical protein